LENILDGMTVEGQLYETLPDEAVRCYACGHRCLIREGKRGICKVRYNRSGTLYVPWGYVASLQADPIEKKPFFHILPGTDALTFGMLGCDFHCGYCQNWITSQALRDSASEASVSFLRRVTVTQLIESAHQSGSGIVASSYNEPLITSEWAVEIFKRAKETDLLCVYISNGNGTPEVLNYLQPFIDGFKIDLKTMQDKQYRKLGGVLNNVLDSISLAFEFGYWVEVVTLIVPGFNDSTSELMDAARFIASVSKDIPWHVTAFHPDYQMTDPPRTSVHSIIKAAEIGQEAGLRYVYAGNLPGKVDPYENTLCHNCQTLLIERFGYIILSYKITEKKTCPNCGVQIPGIWSDKPDSVRIHGSGMPQPFV
jgi:pyruvate formate lyase activating enzyme